MRVNRPRLCAEWNRIEMAGKSDRQLPWSAADTGNDLCPVFTEWDDVDREASVFQQSGKRFSASTLGTRRIDGIEANKILSQLN